MVGIFSKSQGLFVGEGGGRGGVGGGSRPAVKKLKQHAVS